MILRLLSLVALVMAAAHAFADEGMNEHLLAGVRAFRSERYEAALVEFQKVQQSEATADLALYLGPTFYKLGRFDDARRVLSALHRAGAADSVADYYLALSYYRLGFLRLARAFFLRMDTRDAGPKVAEGATRFIAEIDRHPTDGVQVSQLLGFAETLERSGSASGALEAAEEAYLRSGASSAEHQRGLAIIIRLAPALGMDEVARAAVAEHAPPAVSR
jgi:tetratricopeptide (TPR) repeat protein